MHGKSEMQIQLDYGSLKTDMGDIPTGMGGLQGQAQAAREQGKPDCILENKFSCGEVLPPGHCGWFWDGFGADGLHGQTAGANSMWRHTWKEKLHAPFCSYAASASSFPFPLPFPFLLPLPLP